MFLPNRGAILVRKRLSALTFPNFPIRFLAAETFALQWARGGFGPESLPALTAALGVDAADVVGVGMGP